MRIGKRKQIKRKWMVSCSNMRWFFFFPLSHWLSVFLDCLLCLCTQVSDLVLWSCIAGTLNQFHCRIYREATLKHLLHLRGLSEAQPLLIVQWFLRNTGMKGKISTRKPFQSYYIKALNHKLWNTFKCSVNILSSSLILTCHFNC